MTTRSIISHDPHIAAIWPDDGKSGLAQLVGVDPRNVHRTLDPARRYGVVRLVDQAWEWCA